MPQNQAANNFATTLSAALFGSTTLSAALAEGTAYTALSVAATDGPIAAGDTLTLSEASAITLAAGANLSTTLAAALTEGTSYTSLTAAGAATLPQNATVALQDEVSTGLTTALTEGTAVTSLACAATNGALGVGAILLLSVSSGATLATALAAGTQYTSITVGAASAANTIASGAFLQLVSGSNTQTLTVTANATLSTTADTTISVVAFTANYAYPVGATVNVQQNAAVSTAAAAAATSISIYSMTPVFSFGTATVLYAQQNWMTSGATTTTNIPVNEQAALYAFSTAATVTATPPSTATVAGAIYTSLLVGALSGALGSGATLTLPGGESTMTSAAAASGATAVSVNAVQAKGSYAGGADVPVSQSVTCSVAAASGATSIPITSATALWPYTTATTITATTSAISLTSTTGAPSAYPYLLSLTKAGLTYPNPANPLEVVQVTAAGVCTRGVEGAVAAWASGDNAGNNYTAGTQNTSVSSSSPMSKQARTSVLSLGQYGLAWYIGASGSGGGVNGRTLGVGFYTGTTPNSFAYWQQPTGAPIPLPGIGQEVVWTSYVSVPSAPQLPGDYIWIRLWSAQSPAAHGVGFNITPAGTFCFFDGQTVQSPISIARGPQVNTALMTSWCRCTVRVVPDVASGGYVSPYGAYTATYFLDDTEVGSITTSGPQYDWFGWGPEYWVANGPASPTSVALSLLDYAIYQGDIDV